MHRDQVHHRSADRLRLALAARRVAGLEPGEAEPRVVLAALFRQQQGEAMRGGEVGPAAAMVEAGRILGAAMQRHQQPSPRAQALRDEGPHAERAGVGAEARQVVQPLLPPGMRGGRRAGAPADEVGDGGAQGVGSSGRGYGGQRVRRRDPRHGFAASQHEWRRAYGNRGSP